MTRNYRTFALVGFGVAALALAAFSARVGGEGGQCGGVCPVAGARVQNVCPAAAEYSCGKCPGDHPTTKPSGECRKVVNTKCPIMGGKVDPDKVPDKLTRVFKGRKVGFCCGGCPKKWDALSDEEKETKLAAALKDK